ncbi:MAG: alpha-mannosidase [Pyrinomonadaceae bacterium]|nr:alpha-mannosidase [Phycisphaerales bacterium]
MATPQELADRLRRVTTQYIEPAVALLRIPLETSVWQSRGAASLQAARDASFVPVSTGWRWGPVWSTAWFRARAKIPAGMSLNDLSLRFSCGTEATVWGDENGKPLPLHGLDLNHTLMPLALLKQPDPGGDVSAQVELYIEAACNRPLGATTFFWDNPAEVERWKELLPGILEFSELVVCDAPVDLLHSKLRFAASLLTTVDASSPTLAQLETIVARIEQHVQSLAAIPASNRHSEPSGRQAGVQSPAPIVQIRSQWDGTDFYPVLDVLADHLLSLAPAPATFTSATRSTCLGVGHAHIDTAWLWTLSQTRRKCLRTFATALHLLDQHPEFRFVCTQAQQYAWVEEDCPALFEKIRQQVIAGRWEAGGAMWIEPDCNMPSGESFIRQVIHGTRYWRERFGGHGKQTYLYLPDTFGFPASLPQIIAGCGLTTFVFNKLWWNETNPPPFSAFLWEGIDGTRVMSYLTPGMEYNATLTPPEFRKGDTNHREKDVTAPSQWLQPFGFGNGGGGPTEEMIRAAILAEKAPSLPRVAFTRIDEFCESLHARLNVVETTRGPGSGIRVPAAETTSQVQGFRTPTIQHPNSALAVPATEPRTPEPGTRTLPIWPEHELYLERHRGTYTTQAWIKKANRRAEDALRLAECLAFAGPGVLAAEQSQQVRLLLDEAWKLTLLNQFHDILPGSSIGPVYDDARRQYARIQSICEQVIHESRTHWCEYAPPIRDSEQGKLQSKEISDPTEAATRAYVFNPCSSPRAGVIEADGALVFVPHIDPLGIREVAANKIPSLQQSGTRSGVGPVSCSVAIGDAASSIRLSNGIIELQINPAGSIDGLKLAASPKAFTQSLNILTMYDDMPKYWEAWDIDKDYAQHPAAISPPDQFRVLRADPLRTVVEVSRPLGSSSRITQRFVLDAGSPRLDVQTTVDWHESRKLLRVEFPTNIHASHATYDIQFGHIRRSTSGDGLFNAARFEVCAHRWMDLSQPQAEWRSGSASDSSGAETPAGLGLAILNDCKYGHSCRGGLMGLTLLRSTRFPDETADMGLHDFTYSLMPHHGDWRAAGVDQEAESLNRPMIPWTIPARNPMSNAESVPSGGAHMKTNATAVPTRADWSPFTLHTHACGGYVEIAAVKPSEDLRSLIVRLVETRGVGGPVRVGWNIPVQNVQATDLMEDAAASEELQHDPALSVTTFNMRPFQIVTLKVQRSAERSTNDSHPGARDPSLIHV